MKLRDLKQIVNHFGEHELDDEVVVSIAEKGFPGTPCVKVIGICMGFDWDHGKAMIQTEVPLVKKSNSNHS